MHRARVRRSVGSRPIIRSVFSETTFKGVSGRVYGLAGPPALCVAAGNLEAFGPRPDVVLSGVNAGLNTGRSALHSGTVGAALAAQNFGLRAMAVSLADGEEWHWKMAAELAIELLPAVLAGPERGALNLNAPSVPRSELRGVRWAALAEFGSVQSAISKVERDQLHFYHKPTGYEPEPDTDLAHGARRLRGHHGAARALRSLGTARDFGSRLRSRSRRLRRDGRTRAEAEPRLHKATGHDAKLGAIRDSGQPSPAAARGDGLNCAFARDEFCRRGSSAPRVGDCAGGRLRSRARASVVARGSPGRVRLRGGAARADHRGWLALVGALGARARFRVGLYADRRGHRVAQGDRPRATARSAREAPANDFFGARADGGDPGARSAGARAPGRELSSMASRQRRCARFSDGSNRRGALSERRDAHAGAFRGRRRFGSTALLGPSLAASRSAGSIVGRRRGTAPPPRRIGSTRRSSHRCMRRTCPRDRPHRE